MSHEQRVRDFMMQASPSTDSVSELFHNAIAELETLREAVTLEADLEKPNQDREKLQQYVQSRALVIDRETAKCALIFGSSGNAIDIESVQHVLEGVVEPSRQMVAAAQLYLRFFGLPMKSVVTKKLNEILEGLKGTLSQNAIEHWKKVQASSSTSWDEISFSITPLQRQLAGPMERLCNNVKYLPSCDAEAVKQTIKRVADITSDSIKELKESLPEKPSDNDIQQQHEVERNDDEDNPGKSSCYEDEDFEDEVDKSTWCNRDIALSHECLGMLNDALTVLLHLMSNVSTAAKEWYQLIRHIDENVTGCNLPEQVQNIMGKDLEWLTATNEAVSAFEGILVDFAYAADTLEEVSPAANQMKVQLDDMLSLWEHYAERIEDVDNLRMARRSLGLEKVKEFKAKIEDRIAAMEKYL